MSNKDRLALLGKQDIASRHVVLMCDRAIRDQISSLDTMDATLFQFFSGHRTTIRLVAVLGGKTSVQRHRYHAMRSKTRDFTVASFISRIDGGSSSTLDATLGLHDEIVSDTTIICYDVFYYLVSYNSYW